MEAGIWQVIVNPPRKLGPVAIGMKGIVKGRDDNAGGSPHPAFCIALIPYMSGIIGFIRRAVVTRLLLGLHLIAKSIDFGRAISGTNSDTPEAVLKWFK